MRACMVAIRTTCAPKYTERDLRRHVTHPRGVRRSVAHAGCYDGILRHRQGNRRPSARGEAQERLGQQSIGARARAGARTEGRHRSREEASVVRPHSARAPLWHELAQTSDTPAAAHLRARNRVFQGRGGCAVGTSSSGGKCEALECLHRRPEHALESPIRAGGAPMQCGVTDAARMAGRQRWRMVAWRPGRAHVETRARQVLG